MQLFQTAPPYVEVSYAELERKLSQPSPLSALP